MTKSKKRFDAVEMMRSARDRISAEIQGMSLQEELDWLATQEVEDPFLKRLKDRTARKSELPRQRSSPVG